MKTKIISLMLVLSCAGASAATALPNSSGDLRALEENRADGDKTAVLTKEETNTDVSGSRKFYLQNFVFTSEDAIQQDVLAALVESYCGREVDFNELQQAVNKLTAYLRGQGYAVATAFLPQQEITDGIIEVKIVLGRLSYVQVNNTSALAEGQAEKAAGILQKGELLRTSHSFVPSECLESALSSFHISSVPSFTTKPYVFPSFVSTPRKRGFPP